MPQSTYQTPSDVQTLFSALLGWVLGAALQLQQVELWSSGIYACFVAVASVFIVVVATKKIASTGLLRHGALRQLLAMLALASLGFATTGLRAAAFMQDGLAPALEGQDVVVTGVVANLPQRNEAAVRFRLQVESAQWQGHAVVVPPRIDVGWYGGAYPAGPGVALGVDVAMVAPPLTMLNRLPPTLQAGERWQMTLRLKAPHGARNPNGFDYELWLWEQGVQATGYVRATAKDVAPQRLGSTWLAPVARVRQNVRDAIFARVENRQQAGLIAALVVGDQAAIDRADWDIFRATGVAHLVSISGLHITMFAWGATLLAAWGWRRSGRLCRWVPAPSAALVLGVLVAVAYSAFAGWGVPAQRTCLMLAAMGLLRLSGARWPWPWVWMLACALVVAMDPWALLQPGFWLSFVAVGVLFATDLGAAKADFTWATARQGSKNTFWSMLGRATGSLGAKFPAGPPQGKLTPLGGSAAHAVASVGAMLREQWVVTVALAPLTLLLFGQMSVVGLVANAIAIPWVTLVVTPLALLGSLLPALWDAAAWAVSGLLVVLQALAAWPGATWAVAVPPLGVACLGALGGLLAVAPLPPALRVLGLPLLLPVLLWQAPRPPSGEFELLAADVGQGNAVLVRTARHALLFDAGPRFSLESDAGHRVLVPLLQSMQERLDIVVLSHRDIDHVGGAPAVLTMQPQAALISSMEADNALQRLRPAQRCVAGQSWQWDGVTFTILHPQASDYEVAQKPNAMSCVLRISNGRQTALMTGDIEQPQEARLVAGQAALRATVLLVPHHGSNTSSSAAFLDAVSPRVAIVQSGYRNRFGHPTALVSARYAERQIAVVDSPHCGAYVWRSAEVDVNRFGACWRISSQRYWHHRVP